MRSMRALDVAALAAAVVAQPVMQPWPLEGIVDTARQLATGYPLASSTGLKRADYLPTIHGIVQYFRQFQNATGHIIDPYRGEETQYATPCFSYACATLYMQGLDDTLLPNCTAALTAASTELATHSCADGHCVFFMKPMMFAYRLLSGVVDSSVKAVWDANLQAMNPWVDFGWPTNNWGLVGTMDMLRTTLITHFGNSSWWTAMLDFQLSGVDGGGQGNIFTANGLYQDHTGSGGLNPLPYDTFPVSGYLTVMLREGYNGSWAPFLREVTRRAAWSHMLMQSPWGEIPTGGRSSQHTWNEAVSALAYELLATQSKQAGDMQAACMFQRAAHLSHESVRRWQNPSGYVQIVKNHFDPSLRWGYEVYSYLSQYNLLPAAMLAAAYAYADPEDAIPECATFADVGGYSFQLPEHHLVIANAGGVYALVETSPDPHYDSGGLHRVHINTCGANVPAAQQCTKVNALLAPSAGPPQENGGVGIGPWWSVSTDGAGVRSSLGNQTYESISGVIYTPGWPTPAGGNAPSGNISAGYVTFSLQYYLLPAATLITQSYVLSASGDLQPTVDPAPAGAPALSLNSGVQLFPSPAELLAHAEAKGVVGQLKAEHVAAARASASGSSSTAGTLTRFGLEIPAFLFDGATNTSVSVQPSSNSTTVSGPAGSGWGSVSYSVSPAAGHALTWSYDPSTASQTVSRNGLIGTVFVESTFSTGVPDLTLVITASNN